MTDEHPPRSSTIATRFAPSNPELAPILNPVHEPHTAQAPPWAATCGPALRSLCFRALALPSAPVAAPALRPPPPTMTADIAVSTMTPNKTTSPIPTGDAPT